MDKGQELLHPSKAHTDDLVYAAWQFQSAADGKPDGLRPIDKDKTVKVWDREELAQILSPSRAGPAGSVVVAFSPDPASVLASGQRR